MEGGREGGREGGHVPGLGALAGHKHEAVLDVLDLAGDGVLLEVQLHQAGLWEGGREEEVVNDCALVKPHYIYKGGKVWKGGKEGGREGGKERHTLTSTATLTALATISALESGHRLSFFHPWSNVAGVRDPAVRREIVGGFLYPHLARFALVVLARGSMP